MLPVVISIPSPAAATAMFLSELAASVVLKSEVGIFDGDFGIYDGLVACDQTNLIGPFFLVNNIYFPTVSKDKCL